MPTDDLSRNESNTQHRSQSMALEQLLQRSDPSANASSALVTSHVEHHLKAREFELATLTSSIYPFIRDEIQRTVQSHLREALHPCDRAMCDDNPAQPMHSTASDVAQRSDKSNAKMLPVHQSRHHRRILIGDLYSFTKVFIAEGQRSDRAGEFVEDKQYAVSRYVFVPFQWVQKLLYGYAIDLRIAQADRPGWAITLETPRLQPSDAPIFKFCREGNIDGVRDLLFRGQASVLDVNHRGFTPLLQAAESGRASLCQLLIDWNADVHACDWTRGQKDVAMSACGGIPLNHGLLSNRSKADFSREINDRIMILRMLLAAGYDLDSKLQAWKSRSMRLFLIPSVNMKYLAPDIVLPGHMLYQITLPTIRENKRIFNNRFWTELLRDALVNANINFAVDILNACEVEVARDAMVERCGKL